MVQILYEIWIVSVHLGCPDTLEQLEIYEHTKMQRNNILSEQTQFKSCILFEHITQHSQWSFEWWCHHQKLTVLLAACYDEACNEWKLVQAVR